MAPASVRGANQKALDDNAAAAEKSLKGIEDRIDLIKRVADPDSQIDYAGPEGPLKKNYDRAAYYFRYGGTTADFRGNLSNEEQRRVQALAAIKSASTYKNREDQAAKHISTLMDEAGSESGKAAALRAGISGELRDESTQNSVDRTIAGLHEAAAQRIASASGDHTAAVDKFTTTAVSGFNDVKSILQRHQAQLEEHTRAISRTKNATELH